LDEKLRRPAELLFEIADAVLGLVERVDVKELEPGEFKIYLQIFPYSIIIAAAFGVSRSDTAVPRRTIEPGDSILRGWDAAPLCGDEESG
jgi:hypothetical protein